MISHLDNIKKVQAENELLKKLATKTGFIRLYYEKLPKFKYNYLCFEHINSLHLEKFGEEKYSCWNSFCEAKNKHFRKPSK